MQPVMTSLIASITGLLGVIIGHLFTARRENRRRRWEQEREEERWTRELQRQQEQRQHENVLDWRGRRIEAYSDALEHIEKLRSALFEVTMATIRHYPKSEDEKGLERYAHIHTEKINQLRAVDNAISGMFSLRLYATKPVQKKLSKCMIALNQATDTAIRTFEENPKSQQLKFEPADFDFKIDELKEAIRKELGLTETVDNRDHIDQK